MEINLKIEYNDVGEKLINGKSFIEIKKTYYNFCNGDHVEHLEYFFYNLNSQQDLLELSRYLKDNELGSIPTIIIIISVMSCSLSIATDIYAIGFRDN